MAFYEVLVSVGIALIFGFGASFIIEKGVSWQMFMYATSISMAVMIQVGALGIEWIIVPAFLLIAMIFVGRDTYE